jgi:MFS family permease
MTEPITTPGAAAKDHHSRVQAAAERALADQTNLQLSRARLVTVFAALSLTLLISFVDQNGIGVTLPTIAVALEAGDTISWAGTSSLIANTAFVMLYGRLSDIFGRKAVFLGAVALLSVAALLCGFAQNAAMCKYLFICPLTGSPRFPGVNFAANPRNPPCSQSTCSAPSPGSAAAASATSP